MKRGFLTIYLIVLLFAVNIIPLFGGEGEIADLQFKYANSFWEEGYFFQARKEYQKLVELYPDNENVPRALIRIGDSSIKLYDFDRAQKAYQRAASEYADLDIAAEARLKLGDYYRSNREYEKAAVEYSKILDYYPGSREAIKAQIELRAIAEHLPDFNKEKQKFQKSSSYGDKIPLGGRNQ